MKITGHREAFGAPGLEPRWSSADKDGVGTAYNSASRIWFTLAHGIVTEVYSPTIDMPQIRDLQYLVTDGSTFFQEERRHLQPFTSRLDPSALGYKIVNLDPDGRYTIEKQVIADPHYPCVLQRTVMAGAASAVRGLRMFVLCAPHLAVGGWHNNAYVIEAAGERLLVAEKDGTWLAIAATRPFLKLSVGYVGQSDGWSDLAGNFEMDWTFDRATDGNVALTAEIDDPTQPFTLGLAVGNSLHNAVTTVLQSLDVPFEEQRGRFIEQWTRAAHHARPLAAAAQDGGALYGASYSLLLAHEDKTYPGALIASLAIPWGEVKGDEDRGAYHLVWTRDLVNGVLGLLAAGNTETPRRALVYLAASQQSDGGFAQNAWIDGEPYWIGVQLDEVAFPILLAHRLWHAEVLHDFEPYPMVRAAAAYLVKHGPATEQDRWEEAPGYSPSTLAVTIAALICAADFSHARGDDVAARAFEQYADFLEQHIEAWTVTTEGTLVPGVRRHYIRVHPVAITDVQPYEEPNNGLLTLANVKPGDRYQYPAKEIVDAGFLELVRYGIRRADDPIVLDSLRVVDAVLRVETPLGPCWRRYNHDGYGQREDGGPYEGYGVGRAWPLLTGERAHYELAAGRDVAPYIRAIERFAGTTGLVPEQVWDEADRPDEHMFFGRPTGAARPLMWAHAEYVKLLRSAADGQVFDRIPEVAARYLTGTARPPVEVWKLTRQVATVARGTTLCIHGDRPFLLHWSADEWHAGTDTAAAATGFDLFTVEIEVAAEQQTPIRFSILWTDTNEWAPHDFSVAPR